MHIHIVSHTHWDREWYLTFEQFRLRLVGLIDRLLDMMEAQPDFEYFHLDGQTIVLEDYLELRPEQEPRLRRLIAEGRLLIGPWYDMPDEFLVSGESLIRNLQLGHRIAGRFGTPMPVGYLPDLFGHVAQMPQLLRQFGLDNAILWRGFGGPQAEYWWDAPDGSRVLMMHLPGEGYCNATRVHLDPDRMIERTRAAIEREAARTRTGQVLLMNGVDHVEPHPVIPQLARDLTRTIGEPVAHSTLPAYVDAVRQAVHGNGLAAALEVVHGELRGGEDYANLLPGVFSARTYIKQANARVQTLLEKRAEPLAVFASMLGAPYPAGELQYAWRVLLQNHPHDSICGCSVDAVHQENMTRFARAEQVARAIVDQAAAVVARSIPAAPAGAVRLVAVNTTAVPFDGVIEATVDLPYESDEPRRHLDPQALDAPVAFWPRDARITRIADAGGRSTPFQRLHDEDARPMVMSRFETPWILRARRLTMALRGQVPACGYTVFDALVGPGESPSEEPAAVTVSERTAENDAVRLIVNDDGTVDVVDKRSGVRYARCGELEDVGDAGDEYNYSPPAEDRRVTSADARHVRVARLHAGPLRASFQIDLILPLPEALADDRRRRSAHLIDTPVRIVVSLDAGSPRVTWQVSVDNQSADHRLRLLFPTGAPAIAHVRAESAFAVVSRPARRERPAQVRMEVPVSYGPTSGFTEAGDDRAGAILFGEGLAEYEAVPDEDGRVSTLALTLLRCVGYLSREDLVMRPSGHAGPGLATPGAQCVGRHDFRMAFEPRHAPPSDAALFTAAASFTAPPLVVSATGPGGSRPAEDRFVVLDGGVALSALHHDTVNGGVIVRVFNPDRTAAAVSLRTQPPPATAERVDLLGRGRGRVAVSDDAARFDVGPYEIATLRLAVP